MRRSSNALLIRSRVQPLRSCDELAVAVRADVVENLAARGTERAFERADDRIGVVREPRAAALALHAHLERHQDFDPCPMLRTARKASCGTSTAPTCFIRFFPAFCFSSSFRLRLMSPP